MVKSKKYKDLYETDQLKNAIDEGQVFWGFNEGDYSFPPTFKVERHISPTVYNAKRAPAWCDRILWRSFPGFRISQTSLSSLEEVVTSDHKPVVSSFFVQTFVLPPALDFRRGMSHLTIGRLRATGLTGVDERRMLNSQKKKAGLGKALHAMKHAVKNQIKGEMPSRCYAQLSGSFMAKALATSPLPIDSTSWEGEFLTTDLTANNPGRLKRSLVTLEVLDENSQLVAQAMLPLSMIEELSDSVSANTDYGREFQLDLNYGGLRAGTISGVMSVRWDNNRMST